MDRNRQLITGLGVALFLTCVVLIGTYWFYPRQQAAESALAARAMDFDPFAELEARQRPSINEVPFGEDLEADQPGDQAQDKAQDQAIRQELHEDGITIVFGIRDDDSLSRAARQRPSGVSADAAAYEQMPESDEPAAALDHTSDRISTETPVQDARVSQTASSRDRTTAESTAAAPKSTTTTATATATATAAATAARPSTSGSTTGRQPSAPSRAEQEFWIQIFSGRSRGGADAAREKFYEETSMHPLMTTIDHEGQIFYRLRVGPYIDRRDAEQLLAGLSSGSFGESYISIVYN
ncbi:SPOR domain-containing protein [Spirochaeta dissipatitropha]